MGDGLGTRVDMKTELRVHGQPWAQGFGLRRMAFYQTAAHAYYCPVLRPTQSLEQLQTDQCKARPR